MNKFCQVFRNAWADGLDTHPANGLMSPWAKALFSGDYEETLMMLDFWNSKGGDVRKLIEKRETLYNISATFLVIIGARFLTNPDPQFDSIRSVVNNKEGHIKILVKLLDLGANLAAHDFAG